MKVTFLGSAASESIPFPYCNCETCEHARIFKGKNIRKRCSYMINDDLLIDLGPDLFTACTQHDVDLINIKNVLVTHSHFDHFNVQNLTLRQQHFHKGTQLPVLNLIAGPSIMTLLSQAGVEDKNMGLQRVPILPSETIKIESYTIKSIKATHLPQIGDAMNYLIDDGKSKVLIASDTGVYTDQVFNQLIDASIDTIIFEATKGFFSSNKIHMNVDDIKGALTKMREINAVKETTEIYATHFGHQHCPPHEELSEGLEKYDINCVYDGLIVNT